MNGCLGEITVMYTKAVWTVMVLAESGINVFSTRKKIPLILTFRSMCILLLLFSVNPPHQTWNCFHIKVMGFQQWNSVMHFDLIFQNCLCNTPFCMTVCSVLSWRVFIFTRILVSTTNCYVILFQCVTHRPEVKLLCKNVQSKGKQIRPKS